MGLQISGHSRGKEPPEANATQTHVCLNRFPAKVVRLIGANEREELTQSQVLASNVPAHVKTSPLTHIIRPSLSKSAQSSALGLLCPSTYDTPAR